MVATLIQGKNDGSGVFGKVRTGKPAVSTP
jgi:hypothetical protein